MLYAAGKSLRTEVAVAAPRILDCLGVVQVAPSLASLGAPVLGAELSSIQSVVAPLVVVNKGALRERRRRGDVAAGQSGLSPVLLLAKTKLLVDQVEFVEGSNQAASVLCGRSLLEDSGVSVEGLLNGC